MHLGGAKMGIKNIGCYILIRKNEVVYVGKSVNLLSRINTHLNEGLKDFDDYDFIYCEKDELDKKESELIKKYNPEYNIQKPISEYSYLDVEVQKLRYFPDGIYTPPSEIRKVIKTMGFDLKVLNLRVAIKKSDVELLKEKIIYLRTQGDIDN